MALSLTGGQDKCDQFLDPLIEHPTLILILDLVLLKPRVFLHLLFNRGCPPFDATAPQDKSTLTTNDGRQAGLSEDALKLGGLVVTAETILKLQTSQQWVQGTDLSLSLIVETVIMVLVQIATQQLVTMGLVLILLLWRRWYPTPETNFSSRDGRQVNFQYVSNCLNGLPVLTRDRPLLISLTLLYTTILPLLLQIFLSIWYNPTSSHHETLPATSSSSISSVLPRFILDISPNLFEIEQTVQQTWKHADRVWIGTRLLGGMSAGFGLRVLLPTSPAETTLSVIVGWIGGDLARVGTETLAQNLLHA